MGLLTKLFGPKEPEVWPVHIDDSNFESEVLRSQQPVMLDVWGPGCAPCKKLEPVIINMAKRYHGRVKVAEVNAAAAPRTMEKLGVMGTPTVVYFRDGHEVERVVGFRGELYHQEIIETDLLGSGQNEP
ncbi:MAG: thioredoxin family protein [Myxococcales bacterium]|jgi:thioredoxin 1